MTYYIILMLLLASCQLYSSDAEKETIELIKSKKIDLNKTGDLRQLISKSADKKLVLLGESTHGTSDYYIWRAEISKELIKNHNFQFIAVEGDWASLHRLNLYVKHLCNEHKDAKSIMKSFDRWPAWLWANQETADLIEWMKKFNKNRPLNKRVGFYGIDVYGQWEALDNVTNFVNSNFPEHTKRLHDKLNCYKSHYNNDLSYVEYLRSGNISCDDNIDKALMMIYNLKRDIPDEDYYSFFNAKQSAYVVKNAEKYFRFSLRNNILAWNSRVEHMFHTINRLLNFYGDDTKAIVWAHNTHIGDASATDMAHNGVLNIGLHFRRHYQKQNIMLVGFGTYKGTVNAGERWGEDMKIMNIPPAYEGSIEKIFRAASKKDFYLIFDDDLRNNVYFHSRIPHRAIGVTYNPINEQANYVPSVISDRYDAFIFISESGKLNTFE